MTYYEGLYCPVCDQPFTDEADVVVCPQCGLPHHRSCWAVENHCHEEDKHGTPEQWSRNKQNEASSAKATSNHAQICPSCSAENAQYAEFCTRCGADLDAEDWHSAPASPPPVNEYTPRYTPFSAAEHYEDNEIISDTPAKELAAVVGNNAPYYIQHFRRTNQNKACGWNWAACLLGPLWMLYRKQYVTGGLLFILDTACTLIYNLFNYSVYQNLGVTAQPTVAQMMASPWFNAAMAASVVLILTRVLLGIFGNNLYLSFCKNKIRKAKLEVPDISSFELSTKGGVSLGVAVIFYFLSSMISNAVIAFLL